MGCCKSVRTSDISEIIKAKRARAHTHKNNEQKKIAATTEIKEVKEKKFTARTNGLNANKVSD